MDHKSTDHLGKVESMHTKNVILNGKATMTGYSKNEIQALTSLVNSSSIGKTLKKRANP